MIGPLPLVAVFPTNAGLPIDGTGDTGKEADWKAGKGSVGLDALALMNSPNGAYAVVPLAGNMVECTAGDAGAEAKTESAT